jgi:hypothetical protein
MKCSVCGQECKNSASYGMHQLMAHQIARPVSPSRSAITAQMADLRSELASTKAALADSQRKLTASLADSGKPVWPLVLGTCPKCHKVVTVDRPFLMKKLHGVSHGDGCETEPV